MTNPVLNGTDNSNWPVVIPAGQWSPWITAVGSDADAQTVTGVLKLIDQAGNESNEVTIGPFVFEDKLIANLLFAPGVPAQVEYAADNPLKFRVKNTNV